MKLKCKPKILERVPHLKIADNTKVHKKKFPQWLLDLCTELPELKIYDCTNDLYDELGEY